MNMADKKIDPMELSSSEYEDSEESDSSEDSKTAEEHKVEGNEMYKKGNYRGAIACYSHAVELEPESPIYYTNRSAASFMILKYDDVISDCSKAISMDPNYLKAYFRLAKAYVAKVQSCYVLLK